MECVILWRNTQNGAVGFISRGDTGEIEVFPNRDVAISIALSHPLLNAFPCQIVELEDL